MAEARYTRLPAACRREREQEEQATRAFQRWTGGSCPMGCGPWEDAANAAVSLPPHQFAHYSHLYDAKETPCS